MMKRHTRTALVLGGGAARGAYEAGVMGYLREELSKDLGFHVPIDVLAGTSVGAINACYLAAAAADPSRQAEEMANKWTSLRIENVLSFGARDAIRLVRDLVRRTPSPEAQRDFGGIVDPSGLRELVRSTVPWRNISRNIRSGALYALSVSCTRVASGRTTVFLQRRGRDAPPWSRDFHYRAIAARIGPSHALASAAIPLLFPAVPVGGELYVDGGLRQSVPLSPALRLGARRVIVVSLRHRPVTNFLLPGGGEVAPGPEHGPAMESEEALQARLARREAEKEKEAFPTAAFIAGKTLDALLLDRIDEDLNRLRRFNAILEAGTKSYGPSFESVLNDAFAPMRHHPMQWIRNILVHPSQHLGTLAAEYARSPEFRKRASGFVGGVVRRLAESEAMDRADLVSYLLFDGGFAARLVELGRNDARAKRDEWLRFFSSEPESETEAAQFEMAAAASEHGGA